MKWTNEQREAIEKSGKNILLAAAAGSGKTAVLVQRIIELISRKEDPININELLVLTFTDAAAREMREKISAAIEKALRENPKDKHLQNQRLFMHSANISTIHSFCMHIIKNNIHTTDLPVNFSLISETENKMLLEKTLDKVLDRFYGRMDKDPSIKAIVMGYGGIKNDMSLRDTVLSLLNFSKSMPYPAKWLNSAVREFGDVSKSGTLKGSVWQKWLTEKLQKSALEIEEIYKQIDIEIKNRLGADHPYMAFFSEEWASIKRMFSHIDTEDYDSARRSLYSFDFERLVSVKRGAEGEILIGQEKVKALRALSKSCIEDLWELYKIPTEDVIKRIDKNYFVLRTLKNIVLITDRSYTKQKREKNFLDFSDLEHEALKLLAPKMGEASRVAEELQKKYREILIDEYQDTNHIQDTIFRTVSRDNKNIFMVGDLKQSIYTFRNAVPKLFFDKYQSYDKNAEDGFLIRLFKNFRSRSEVVDMVNYIFRIAMSTDVGDVNYTEEEYLIRGAEYPKAENEDDFMPEFHFAAINSEEDAMEELSKHEIEARIVANRILEMMSSKLQIFDKTLAKMRTIKYKDIVVLMRNTNALAPVFEQVFEECGIPIYTEVGKGYLDAREVRTVLAFLQIIDNPRQDIPLIAVMRSPIFNFSPEDLANMRTLLRKGCFFEVVQNAARNGDEKAKAFLNELDKLREMSKDRGVARLIWYIYYELGYYAYSGAQSKGKERQANLRLLFERAAEFEHTGLSGLFSFMAYIETIKSQGGDLTPSKVLGDGDDVVRIMTVHKSKGLEFPIVILSDTGHEFNTRDLNKNIIWNTDMGLGADYVDTKMRVRYPSLPREIVAAKTKEELLSEEMRLLYVALTRAREKLIVTGTFKQTKSGPKAPLYNADGRAKAAYIRKKNCFRDWIMAAVLKHPDAENLRQHFGFDGVIEKLDCGFKIKTYLYKNQSEIPVLLPASVKDEQKNYEISHTLEDVKDRIQYRYEYENAGKIPIKISVSEAKKRMQADDEEYIPTLMELKVNSLSSLDGPKGAEKGTIIHFVISLLEPSWVKTKTDIEDFVKELLRKGAITESQAEAVDCEKIFAFFDSDLGKRLKKAVRVEREFSFYTKAKSREIYSFGDDSDILVQGTMDCFFVEEDGKIVLIDFKTDKGSEEVLSEKYKVQLRYYKKALSEILQKEVDECYLYFLDCGKAIRMEDEE